MINKRFLAVWDVIPGHNDINDLSNDKLNMLLENNIDVEFTDYDAGKKVMQLYTQHAKRFNK